MDWGPLSLWDLSEVGSLYAVKISPTAVHTSIGKTFGDSNVKLEVHVTDSDRLIGYTLRVKKTRWKPTAVMRPSCLSLFYSDTKLPKRTIRKKMKILYDSSGIRLLAFGYREDSRDYMFVVRGGGGA